MKEPSFPNRRVVAALALLLLGLCGACASEIPATEVIVVVYSDLEVGETLTSLKVWVEAADGAPISESPFPFALTKETTSKGEFTLPLSFGISKPKDGLNRFRVTVAGYGPLGAKGEEIKLIEQVAVASFEDRRTLRMTVFLGSVCLRKSCGRPDEGLVCYPEPSDAIAAGACGPVPTAAVERVEPKDELIGIVGADGESGEGGQSERDAGTPKLDSGARSMLDGAVVGPSPRPDSGAGGLSGGGTGNVAGKGSCCSNGDCLCHGTAPTTWGAFSDPSSANAITGPFRTATVPAETGTIHYPTDAEPPFAAVVLAPADGGLEENADLTTWAAFYASYGIVAMIMAPAISDPFAGADSLLRSIAELKGIASGPLAGKLSGRYGTFGEGLAGGAALIAASETPAFKSIVALEPEISADDEETAAVSAFVETPALMAWVSCTCGSAKFFYPEIPASTPKMEVELPSLSPALRGPGNLTPLAGYALAFHKVFLEGDERWKPLLLSMVSGATRETNIR
jgi:hypothetical protein